MEPRLTPLLGLACPDKAKAFRGGPVVGHHPTESQSFPWWTCGRPPSNGEPKLFVVDLWSATIQRRAKAFRGGPVVGHHPTESQSFPWWTCGRPPSNGEPKLSMVDLWSATIQRRAKAFCGGLLFRPHQTERPPGIEPGAVELRCNAQAC